MGRYFGIGNRTKGHVISSYWKADEWCDLYAVMHQFGWDYTDEIYSCCYDTYCIFRYNPETKEMEVNSDVPQEEEEEEEEEKKEEEGEQNVSATLETKEVKKESQTTLKFGFNPNLLSEKTHDHCPVWVHLSEVLEDNEGAKQHNNKVCMVCQHKARIPATSAEAFDAVFCMS